MVKNCNTLPFLIVSSIASNPILLSHTIASQTKKNGDQGKVNTYAI
jgi:hypothetical protein